MTRSELEKLIAKQQPELSPETVSLCVDRIIQDISDTVVLGGRVEIRGFGTFGLRRRKSRVGRNPKTGDQVDVPERYVPFFRPGSVLRKRVNDALQRENSAKTSD